MAIALGRNFKLVDPTLMTKLRADPSRVPKDWGEPRKPGSPDTVYISRELIADGHGGFTILGLWHDGTHWRKIDYLEIFADRAFTEPPVSAPAQVVNPVANVDPAHAEPPKKAKAKAKKGDSDVIISLEPEPEALTKKEKPALAGAPA